MGKNIVEKILDAHIVSGEAVVGQEVGIRIDQTLTQDATGTMAYLQFEAMERNFRNVTWVNRSGRPVLLSTQRKGNGRTSCQDC